MKCAPCIFALIVAVANGFFVKSPVRCASLSVAPAFRAPMSFKDSRHSRRENDRDYLDEIAKPCGKDTALAVTVVSTLSILSAGALPAEAAAGVVPTALWAYAHYLAMLVIMGCLVAERTLLKPQMTQEEESFLGMVDLGYSLSLLFLVVTGYFRLTDFGKGVDFYSHEILFWLKMSFVGILVGCALFPTITLLKRGQNKGAFEPMSDKLVKRLTAVLNAEISAILTIPLLATFMARGVWYAGDFPWPAGLVLALVTTGGATYYYGKQALTWSDEETLDVPVQDSYGAAE